MKTTRTPLRRLAPVAAVFSAALLLGGCHVIFGPDDTQEWWYYCDASGCYRCNAAGCELPDGPFGCTRNSECPSGLCDIGSGKCVSNPSTCATSAQCSAGYVCIDAACKPARTPCTSDAACGAGAYCSNGSCKDSKLCKADPDCASLGNFTCDERGSCVPGPVGPASCKDASTCSEGICLGGKCGACSGDCGGGKTCQFEVHCGAGRACLDAQCVNTCKTATDCASTQTCTGGVCVAAPSSCTTNAECGSGKLCVNNSCLVDCTASGSCANKADACAGPISVGSASYKVCVADHGAKPECSLNKDCANNEQCVNGICRTTCQVEKDCEGCNDGPVCGKGGFCMTADEATPECASNADCGGGGKVCLNSRCKTL